MVALDVGGAIKGQHFDIYQALVRMLATVRLV